MQSGRRQSPRSHPQVRPSMKRHCFLLVTALAVALSVAAQSPAPASGPAPRFDSWKIIGPGGGGTTISPAISPLDPNLIVEHSDMTGAYITHDGGQSWRMFNLRSGLETFAFDPSNPRRIYAGGAALWRSDDTGQTWSMLFPDPARKTVEHQNGDHSVYSLTSEDENFVKGDKISQIVVDPKDSNTVHVAYWDPTVEGTTLMLTKDGGKTFHQEHDFLGDTLLLLTYVGGDRVAVGVHGIYRGHAETAKAIGGAGETVASAGASAEPGGIAIYATTSSGQLFVSEDAGADWQDRSPALGQGGGQFGALAVAATNGQIAYVGFRGLTMGERPEDAYNGIAKTVDAGKNWTIVFRESNKPAANLSGSWIEQRADSSTFEGSKSIIFDAPYSLSVSPTNPEICYATDLFRTYRTLDGGKTWAQVNSTHTADNRWTTRGLDVTTSYGIQFDPFDPKHIFIDYTDIGAFQSYNGGQSWESATTGIQDEWRNTTYWLDFDPAVKGLMWGAFSYIHDLPRPKMWRHKEISEYTGGIAVSTDGGKHWAPSGTGTDETAFTHILVDPVSPVGQRYLYASAFGIGVYKSKDNGKTWELKNIGIAERSPYAWRIIRANDGVLYLIIARGNEGRAGTTGGGGAVYKSIDEAEHWKPVNLPGGVNGPTGLAIDPRNSRHMYLSAWGQEHADIDVGGGVYETTDGGWSWKLSFGKSQHVYDVTIDPKSPDTLYICGFDAAAYRTTDAGLHWDRIRGYNFKWGHRVIIDPEDPSKIYITTFGGSVWHGPAAGDPKATEDILTPVPIAQ